MPSLEMQWMDRMGDASIVIPESSNVLENKNKRVGSKEYFCILEGAAEVGLGSGNVIFHGPQRCCL